MRNQANLCSLLAIAAFMAVGLWSAQVQGYANYEDPGGGLNNNCAQCHPGFVGKGALHDLHVGNSAMTNNCDLCHQSNGDNPFIGGPSGDDPDNACSGCHVAEGLRAHHANAGAPPDAFGLFCVTCHPSDPTPPGEDTLPPYYSRADVDVNDPCAIDTGVGGEDWNGDGSGLDNDGDLDYELDDQDCVAVPVEPSTWGSVKHIYR